MLIDTSGWFTIFDLEDSRHDAAVSFYNSAVRRVTHSYILAEFIALSEARKKNRREMFTFLSNLLDDEEIRIIWVDEVLNNKAVELLKSRIDKKWSLCDAVSFVLMSEMRITDGLTTDHHFEQADFIRLLNT